MNKTQLLTQHDCKLYDLSDPKDMHRMNMNLQYHNKKGTKATFKLIAPFNHPMEYKADYYYFLEENTPISEQILREMGFEYGCLKVQKGCRLNSCDNNSVYLSINNIAVLTNVTNANQLHQLINLLK
jgi:hypothetical protein